MFKNEMVKKINSWEFEPFCDRIQTIRAKWEEEEPTDGLIWYIKYIVIYYSIRTPVACWGLDGRCCVQWAIMTIHSMLRLHQASGNKQPVDLPLVLNLLPRLPYVWAGWNNRLLLSSRGLEACWNRHCCKLRRDGWRWLLLFCCYFAVISFIFSMFSFFSLLVTTHRGRHLLVRIILPL